nr:hypothetical protein [Tanacetum cinerariifolium]
MLLLAAKGLLLAVYGGWMVKRDNFSPQQPSQTHRQERLTNKRWQRVKSIWNVVDCNPIVGSVGELATMAGLFST